MARPVVSAVAELMYAALGPLRAPDEANNWHLLKFVASVADRLGQIEDIARDTEDGPGWSALMDPDRVPSNALGFLGQFVGVELLTGLDDASQRLRIKGTAGFKRGSLGALEDAARQTLSGGRQVLVFERDTSPYHVTVRTYGAETPNPALTEAAVRAQKPGSLVLVYQVASGATYAQLDTGFTTYAATDAAFGTYEAQTLWIP